MMPDDDDDYDDGDEDDYHENDLDCDEAFCLINVMVDPSNQGIGVGTHCGPYIQIYIQIYLLS